VTDDLDGAILSHERSIVTEAAGDITPTSRGFAIRSQAANLLSATRIALAIIWLAAFAGGLKGAAIFGSIAIAAAISDLLDGRVARRMETVGAFGKWFDSVADIVFILTALGCEVSAGAIRIYIPILIALSFSQYAIDSMLLSGAPIKSRLGHFGGVINFGIVIVLGIAPPPSSPAHIVRLLCPLLAIYYVTAMGERVIGYFYRGEVRDP
jgi:phosphatidylglycerophosphate synthase